MWKPIPGFSLFEASDCGQVRRIAYAHKRGPHRPLPAVLAQRMNNMGYLAVSITPDGEAQTNRRVHQLVAMAFHGSPEKGQIVCHRDGSRTNNAAANLYWGDHRSNGRDAVKHGAYSGRFKNDDHPTAKLSEKDVRSIRRDIAAGWKLKVLAKHYGVSPATISMVKSGANWGWLQ